MSYEEELSEAVSFYEALGQELAEAGAIDLGPTADELIAYDRAVADVCAANPDIQEHRLHHYVAASSGDFDLAVEFYRSDTAQILREYGAQPQPPAAPAGEYRGQEGLHQAIEQATAQMLRRR
jgi:hypothetical protein